MAFASKRTFEEDMINSENEDISSFQPFQKKLRLQEDDDEIIDALVDKRMAEDDQTSRIAGVEDYDEQRPRSMNIAASPKHKLEDESENNRTREETAAASPESEHESEDEEGQHRRKELLCSPEKTPPRPDEGTASSSTDDESEDDATTVEKGPTAVYSTRSESEKRATVDLQDSDSDEEDKDDCFSDDEGPFVNPAYERMSDAMDTFLLNSKAINPQQPAGSAQRSFRLVLLDDRRPPSDPTHRIEFHMDQEYDLYQCNRFNLKTFCEELSETGHCFSIDMTGTYMIPLAFDVDCLKKDHQTGCCTHDGEAQRINKMSQRFVEETTAILVRLCKIKKTPAIGYAVTSNKRTCGFHVYFDCFVSVFLFDMLYKDVKTISGLQDFNVDRPTSLGLPFYIKVNMKSANEDLASFKHNLVSSNTSEILPFVYCANNLLPEIVSGTPEQIARDRNSSQLHVCGMLKPRNRSSMSASSFYDEDVSKEDNEPPALFTSAFWNVNLQHKENIKEYVVAVQIDLKHMPIVKNVQLNEVASKDVACVLKSLSSICTKFNKPPVYEPTLNNMFGERFITRFVLALDKEGGGQSTRSTTNRRELGLARLQYLLKREMERKETKSFVANLDSKLMTVPAAECPTICHYVFDTMAAVGVDLGVFLYARKKSNKFENILHIIVFMMEGGGEYVMLLILAMLVMRCTEMEPNYIKEVYCAILVTLCDFYIGNGEEEQSYDFNKDDRAIVESLKLIRHCATSIQSNDCTSGMLTIARNKDHLKNWLTDAINNVIILQDHRSMSDFFAYEFNKELNQEEFEALVEQFLRVNLRVLYTARCCYVYRVELGIYTACIQDRFDFKKDHLVKRIIKQLTTLSANNKTCTRAVIQQLVNGYMDNLTPCEVEFNNYPMHICTEQGVFNTITGCYSPHSSFMYFTTCKSYCLTTRTIGCDIIERQSLAADHYKNKMNALAGGVLPLESEYDKYGVLSVNGHLHEADQINVRLINEEIPLYSSLFRVLIEDTWEIRMKCLVIPSLAIMNESPNQHVSDLNRISAVVANFVLTNDSVDDVDRLMDITVLINMYHFDVRHTIVPAYKAIYHVIQENQGEISLASVASSKSSDFMGMSKPSRTYSKMDPPNDQLDIFGFLSSLAYDWNLTYDRVNTYEAELDNCNRFVERFGFELKRSKKNIAYRVDKSVLVLTYIFVILDFCRRDDCKSYFHGIIGQHSKQLKWFMNQSLLEQVGGVTSPYGKVVSGLVAALDTQKYMFNVTEAVLRELIARKSETLRAAQLHLDKFIVHLVHNLLNTFLFDKYLLTDVFISLCSMYSPMSERKKLILLQGPSHSGKSVIVSILTEIHKRSYFALDREVSSRSDSNSATPATLQLYSKYFVSVAELGEIHPGFLKVFTGNDRVHKSMLQSNEYSSDINIAMMVGACNQTPAINTGKKDDNNTIGEEVRNRLVVLPMSLQFKSKPSKYKETILSAFSRGRVMPLYFTKNQEAKIYSPFLSNLLYAAFLYDMQRSGGRVREMKLVSKQAIACSMEVMAKTSVVYRIMLQYKIIFKRRAKLTFEELKNNVTEYALQNSTVEADDSNYESRGWVGISKKTKNEIRRYMKCFKETFPNMVQETNGRFVGIGYESDNATQSVGLLSILKKNEKKASESNRFSPEKKWME